MTDVIAADTVIEVPEQGPQGLRGKTGAGIIAMNATLSDDVGNDGDFFLHTGTYVFYGPKVAGHWPSTGVSLIGPPGAMGFQGPIGPPNGNVIRSGTIDPVAGTGFDGDWYINTTSHFLFGPKAGTWPTGITMIGPTGSQGIQGPTGNAVLHGTGSPASLTGANGDFYIATDTFFFYGPKAAGVWPGGVSLIGPTSGITLRSGTGAPNNAFGSDGDYYIDHAVSYLYGPKVSGAWPTGTSIVGPAGPTGLTGSTGLTGTSMLNGTGVPSAGLGNNGDFYIDVTAKFLYGPKASGAWPAGNSIVGPAGTSPPLATVAQYRTATASVALATDIVFSAAAYITLTDAATILVDASTGFNFTVTLTTSRTLGFPSNLTGKIGQSGFIDIVQPGGGGCSLSFAAGYTFDRGTVPSLDTGASRVTSLYYHVRSTGEVRIGTAFLGVR